MTRSRWLATSLLCTLLILFLAASAAAQVLIVTKRHVTYPHYTTIQAAVGAAHRGDWILIAPGVYHGQVRITKPGLHIRGMNRNTVILDGRHGVGNGIEIYGADDVWVENLTVRNFDRRRRDDFANGNEVWWNGAVHRGHIGLSGWWGQYLTTYDTGLLGGYGLYTGSSVDGWYKHVYGSGFNDAGLYIGACRDCHALVSDALMERNALGYSGSNAGGHLIIENSIFRDNSIGLAPNSDAGGDPPPPQDGACNSGANRSKTPRVASTRMARCTIIRNNLIADNGNLSSPADRDVLGAPWGIGIELPGVYSDLVEGNQIIGNPNFGALVFEYPDPFPPTRKTIYFQVSGNRLSGNRFSGNGTSPGGADIGLEGGAFGSKSSVNNCFSGNAFTTSNPTGIEGTWGCQHTTTPNGTSSLVLEVINLVSQSGARASVAQPAPLPQPTMPHPCGGVPRNPLCG